MRVKRITWVTVGGILLVLAAAAYVYFWQLCPIGSGVAGPKITPALFTRSISERQFLLIGLGDSVTAGFGARHGYSYFDRLVSMPIIPPDAKYFWQLFSIPPTRGVTSNGPGCRPGRMA